MFRAFALRTQALRGKALRSKMLRSTALRGVRCLAVKRFEGHTRLHSERGKVPQGLPSVHSHFSKAIRGLVFSRFLQHILSTKKEHTKVAQAVIFGVAKHRVNQRFCDFLDKKRTSKTVLAPVPLRRSRKFARLLLKSTFFSLKNIFFF